MFYLHYAEFDINFAPSGRPPVGANGRFHKSGSAAPNARSRMLTLEYSLTVGMAMMLNN
jgi:hypothetical protein